MYSVGITAKPSLSICKFLFRACLACSFDILGDGNFLSSCEFKYPVVSIPNISPLSNAIFNFIKSEYIVISSCVYA